MRRFANLLGLALLLFGGWLLFTEMQKPEPHSGHVYLMAGMMAFGCLLMVPTYIGEGLKAVVVVVGPYLPKVQIGGRRADDPPAPEGDA